MDFEKLFEKFDKDILTEDIKKSITDMIDGAVEKLTEAYDVKVEKLTESVGIAMDTAIEEVKEDTKKLVIEAEKVADADKILESMNAHIKKYNINVEVDEEKDAKIVELTESYNTLQEKHTNLEKSNIKNLKTAIDEKVMVGLTVTQSEDMKVFTESYVYDDKYEEKALKIKELVTKKKAIKESVEEEDKDIDTNTKQKTNHLL